MLIQLGTAALSATEVRELSRGYSLDNEEFNRGVRCLAAPIFNAAGTVVAAIGITASIVRFSSDRVPEMAEKVQSVADELSHMLGYAGGG